MLYQNDNKCKIGESHDFSVPLDTSKLSMGLELCKVFWCKEHIFDIVLLLFFVFFCVCFFKSNY